VRFTFKFFTEVLFLSIILCLVSAGIINVLVSTLNSKPDEVTGYECGLYSTKGGRLKDRISFYTVGLTMMIFDVEVILTFAFLLSLTFATTSSFLSVGIFVVILGLDLF
jgi:NADH:ubiquinone oxidoreductase subunit 3 (subunit A)